MAVDTGYRVRGVSLESSFSVPLYLSPSSSRPRGGIHFGPGDRRPRGAGKTCAGCSERAFVARALVDLRTRPRGNRTIAQYGGEGGLIFAKIISAIRRRDAISRHKDERNPRQVILEDQLHFSKVSATSREIPRININFTMDFIFLLFKNLYCAAPNDS